MYRTASSLWFVSGFLTEDISSKSFSSAKGLKVQRLTVVATDEGIPILGLEDTILILLCLLHSDVHVPV